MFIRAIVNFVSGQISAAEKKYYRKKLEEFRNNASKSWNLVSNILNPNQ